MLSQRLLVGCRDLSCPKVWLAGYRDFVLSKWFGLGQNEWFVLWIGLLFSVFRVRVELGAHLGVSVCILLLYMDIEILSCPKIWLA